MIDDRFRLSLLKALVFESFTKIKDTILVFHVSILGSDQKYRIEYQGT